MNQQLFIVIKIYWFVRLSGENYYPSYVCQDFNLKPANTAYHEISSWENFITIFTSFTTLSSIVVIPRIIDVCLPIFELYE